jgi:hypothetical protein
MGLAVDGTSLYWTEQFTACISKMAKGGGAPVALACSPNVP